MTQKTYGVTIENSALAFSTEGVSPGKWLQDAASQVWNAIKSGVQAALDLGNRMIEGGKELFSAIMRGDWGIFGDWLKNDPIGAISGGAAVAVAGWFVGSATGITAVASGGIASMWSALGSVKIGGFTLGLMLPTLQQAIVGTTNVLYNLDWQQSDAAIIAELEGMYLSFLNTVGESTGRMLAGFALGGGKGNPKMTINITASAALCITAQQAGSDIQEELVEELSQLANTFVRYARNLAAKLGYMELRKWARNNVRTGIKGIDDAIANWGLQEGQSFTISVAIDNKVEAITEENPALGNFLEGFIEGFGDGFSDFIVMT
ncbi:MAG: hypothetical protein JGK24_32720 [Microcoleus sp. PH2017_29_MFU_D_A]|uniref:hypothetical protein n=1 Tax=unclassified Microcoleus TaxID=2642155 RepID=UPI001D85BF2B|nr:MULTISPECIES: hypothetical protein [unclassified Microcoleus]MCC3422180.1 hypothetical protein [Microcoleus sp. PH2017_07_MST_O_A]MCC3513779.1 hypothetical protein [Microcoleus sp. PH2017_17_BER_D_A]MCC3458025.1 hypothetical protein [Microcoleus sp. PH2017_08_TRC_O_A]MCC3476450.1 hypothetical protein [Microcoleus sp. PH2017_13_LAR_U_A]MCC3488910.1 hypothetical protein [Microcoleus sp. PH2017_14_LAR_D_A]